MSSVRFQISAGAILLLALIYFFDFNGIVAAAAPAIILHELGHIFSLRLYGCSVRRIKASVLGIVIDYSGRVSRKELALSLAAGPAAGLIYGLAALSAKTEYLTLSGTLSILLTFFNLLPVLPLDGGKIISTAFGVRRAQRLSLVVASGLTAFGLVCIALLGMPAFIAPFVWLLYYNIRQ